MAWKQLNSLKLVRDLTEVIKFFMIDATKTKYAKRTLSFSRKNGKSRDEIGCITELKGTSEQSNKSKKMNGKQTNKEQQINEPNNFRV